MSKKNLAYLMIFLSSAILGFNVAERANASPVVGYERPTGPCVGERFATPRGMPAATVRAHVRNIIGCAVRTWPVSGGAPVAVCVAERESGLYPKAYNASGASGIYQHLASYWPGRVRAYLHRDWFPNAPNWPLSPFRARANVIVTMRMVHAGGWGPWGGGCYA